jgi:hypothetical protein
MSRVELDGMLPELREIERMTERVGDGHNVHSTRWGRLVHSGCPSLFCSMDGSEGRTAAFYRKITLFLPAQESGRQPLRGSGGPTF